MSTVRLTTLGIVAAFALDATSELQAAPRLFNAAVTNAVAALSAIDDVRWSRWGGYSWRGPPIVIGGIGFGAVAGPYLYAAPYWAGYPGYWGRRSSTCWDRGRRVLCPGSLP
jgi:hypothetical protein